MHTYTSSSSKDEYLEGLLSGKGGNGPGHAYIIVFHVMYYATYYYC